jgi:hypothetical protein
MPPPRSRVPTEVRKVRRDLTKYAFHFVNREPSPQETLSKILADRFVEGKVYPPSATPVVCLTDAPLTEIVRQDGVLGDLDYQRLSLWGIGFEKGWLFELGARPVIYQPREEFSLLDSSISWRHVDYDLRSDVDFSWQREWRIPTRKLRFARENVVLVVPEIDVFVSDLWEVFIDVDVSDGEAHLGACTVTKWDFIPLDHAEFNDDASIEVCRSDDWTDIIREEHYGDMVYHDP